MLFANVAGTSRGPRAETRSGREYTVIPVVAIREGVLNGEYVPREEIAASVFAWNDRPVVLGHPQVNGAFVSARGPDTLSAYEVGRLYEVRLDDDRLKGEIWIDVAMAQATEDGRELLRRIMEGQPIEVSTAYNREAEDAPGIFRGDRYGAVARDIVPDHLAILLHERGACSWSDGCGAPRVNAAQEEGGMKTNILERARTPEYNGTTSRDWNRPDLGDYNFGVDSIDELTDAQRDQIASGSLLGDPNAETYAELSFFPVVEPGGALNEGALRAVISGRGAQADIPPAALESARNVARDLLEEEFGVEEEVEGNIVERVARRLLDALTHNIQAHQEEAKMEELVQNILEDGRLGLSEDQLNAMSEGALVALSHALAKLEAVGPVAEPEPSANCGMPEGLAEAVDLVGGTEKAARLLVNAHNVDQEQRGEYLSALNDAGVDTDELESVSTVTLQSLVANLGARDEPSAAREVDYRAPGGGPRSNDIEGYEFQKLVTGKEEGGTDG